MSIKKSLTHLQAFLLLVVIACTVGACSEAKQCDSLSECGSGECCKDGLCKSGQDCVNNPAPGCGANNPCTEGYCCYTSPNNNVSPSCQPCVSCEITADCHCEDLICTCENNTCNQPCAELQQERDDACKKAAEWKCDGLGGQALKDCENAGTYLVKVCTAAIYALVKCSQDNPI
jgi:hypothetical protein